MGECGRLGLFGMMNVRLLASIFRVEVVCVFSLCFGTDQKNFPTTKEVQLVFTVV